MTMRSIAVGYQNLEAELSKQIREEPYARVTKAYLENGMITMVFEPDEEKKYPTFVKQVSKKKYPDLSGFFRKIFRQGGSLICVVETSKSWILFMSK